MEHVYELSDIWYAVSRVSCYQKNTVSSLQIINVRVIKVVSHCYLIINDLQITEQ